MPGQEGAFLARSDPAADAVGLGHLDLAAHGLVLNGGLRLSSIGVRPSVGRLSC